MSEPIGTAMGSFGLDLNVLDRAAVRLEASHLTQAISAYNQTINSFGGFDRASIKLVLPKSDAEWWYDRSLGKRVALTSDAGKQAWDGFINVVTLTAGSLNEQRGPLMDILNRGHATYSPTDYTVVPPVSGSEVNTPEQNNLISQSRYGIIEKVISAGLCSPAMAGWALDVALSDRAFPKISGPISLSANKSVEVQLDCLGMFHWLYAYIYYSIVSGSITIRNKIIAIMGTSPNPYFSTDYSGIWNNTMLVGAAENKNAFAGDVIKGSVALGDTSIPGTKAIFGIYDNAKAQYKAVTQVLEYEHWLSWNRQAIFDYRNNAIIYPWLVRPGKWLIVPDFTMRPAPTVTSLNQDYRTKFIENVSYTAPLSLDLSGGKLDKLSQLLAQITYSSGTS